jgi:hypothetical protein
MYFKTFTNAALFSELDNVISRVLLDWIARLINPDCNPIWWIGL